MADLSHSNTYHIAHPIEKHVVGTVKKDTGTFLFVTETKEDGEGGYFVTKSCTDKTV